MRGMFVLLALVITANSGLLLLSSIHYRQPPAEVLWSLLPILGLTVLLAATAQEIFAADANARVSLGHCSGSAVGLYQHFSQEPTIFCRQGEPR